jgi:hypothetical protein
MNEVEVLREHLIATRLAGPVATSPAHAIDNCRKLVSGDPDYTFGLDGWQKTTVEEARAAIAEVCGPEAVAEEHDGPGWIDPDRCLAAIDRHRDRLGDCASTGGRALLATGHPTGLLAHYAAIGRALVGSGCALVDALDDAPLPIDDDRSTQIRYVDGVACLRRGGDLVHTHRAEPMEAILDTLEDAGTLPDLVIADHGLAGAAIHRGLETLSIADVNDPGLFLAQVRGLTDAVLPIDDNLRPALFEPVTVRMLEKV